MKTAWNLLLALVLCLTLCACVDPEPTQPDAPTATPTVAPTVTPTQPSVEPTVAPTTAPTAAPTEPTKPTPEPTEHTHSFGEWETVTEATCTQKGTKTHTCTVCGESYSESIKKLDHDYVQTETVPATCSQEGKKTFTCSMCGKTYSNTIDKISHSFMSEVTKEATCVEEGIKTNTCSVCGYVTTESISKQSHSYTKSTTKAPTCTEQGIEEYTCSVCGHSYTSDIAALGHSPNGNNICSRCGANCPIKLNMSSSEIKNANKVYYISQRQIFHQDDEGRYVLLFSLLDSKENELSAPCVVEIRITNDAGEDVFSATKVVESSWFGTWSYNNGAVKKYQAAIYIYDNEIEAGKIDQGDVYFTVYNEGYFSFSESRVSISDLPVRQVVVNLPDTPVTLYDYKYNGKKDSGVKITNITYEVSGDDLYIYFTGEKIYDAEGNGYSQSCKIGWKLYDSEGYIIDSGTCYTDALAVGEKFRNQKAYAWDCIEAGGTYTLVILDVK